MSYLHFLHKKYTRAENMCALNETRILETYVRVNKSGAFIPFYVTTSKNCKF